MEGLVALDGGRSVKSAMLAFGALIWAAPLFAQSSPDPLAPLPPQTTPAPAPAATEPAKNPAPRATAGQAATVTPLPQLPIIVTQAAPPPKPAYVPKDWRGVFDAIDSGNWASAQAGIAALPKSILAPVAKAELYTAKGSPVVDLAAIQALIAQAPELPEANQLGLMAIKRGAKIGR